MRNFAVSILLLLSLSVVACTKPARVTLYEERYGTGSETRQDIYSVQRDDTVYRIAQHFGVSTRALIDENRLQPPYRLVVGQKLRLPAPRVHEVARGDTVYAVSRKYGVAASQLVQLNRLNAPYTIFVGQKLRLPGTVETRVARKADATSIPNAPAPARRSEALPPERRASVDTRRPVAPKPNIRRLVPVPKASPAGYVWPVEGRMISAYGAKGKGLHNDGINLAAPRGTPVIAAQNGVVAYAGNELRGFGNLVLIKHTGGVMTAYAHNDAVLVENGQSVTRGQQIAKVGSSGSVDSPQLHFEIRFGREAVDPIRFLGRKSARDGELRTAVGRGVPPNPG